MGLLTPDRGCCSGWSSPSGRVLHLGEIRLSRWFWMVEDRKAYVDQSLKAAWANEQAGQREGGGEKILAQAREEQAPYSEVRQLLRATASSRDAQERARRRQPPDGDEETDWNGKESAIRDIRRQVAVLSVGIAEKIMRNKLADEKNGLRWSTVCWMKWLKLLKNNGSHEYRSRSMRSQRHCWHTAQERKGRPGLWRKWRHWLHLCRLPGLRRAVENPVLDKAKLELLREAGGGT